MNDLAARYISKKMKNQDKLLFIVFYLGFACGLLLIFLFMAIGSLMRMRL